jgi:phosphonate transport system permease protein
MTFLGTVTGCLLAFVLALVAARNTTLHPALRSATRLLFGLERATPNFVVLLVLSISFGYGPFAAMIALAIAAASGCSGSSSPTQSRRSRRDRARRWIS